MASRPVGDPWQLVSDEWVADQKPRVANRTLAYAGSWTLEPRLAANGQQTLGTSVRSLVKLGYLLAMF